MGKAPQRISVLVIGRIPEEQDLSDALRCRGMFLLKAQGADAVRRFALEECLDIVLLDKDTLTLNQFEVLRILQDYCPVAQCLILAREVTVEQAVEFMRQGASDVVRPPFTPDRIVPLIQEAWRRKKILRENRLLRQEIRRQTNGPMIIGRSLRFQRVVEMAKKVAATDATVLIEGETGVGKNLIARLIHLEGNRRDNPFVLVDCSTVPDALFESELFGYHKGAFSGADKLKYGLVEVAHEGTLFLDEVGEVPLSVQPKLLRLTEEGVFRRLGGLRDQQADVRIIASTNRSLSDLCLKGEFRKDLLYRLRVVTIEVPPLRERSEDIPSLATHFLQTFSRGPYPKVLAPEALDLLMGYSWPGNVRELRNILERASILTEGRTIQPLEVGAVLGNRDAGLKDAAAPPPNGSLYLKSHEQHLIRQALARVGGNRRRAAQMLGIGERSLYRRLKRENFQES